MAVAALAGLRLHLCSMLAVEATVWCPFEQTPEEWPSPQLPRSVRPEVGSSHQLPRPAGAQLVDVLQEQYWGGVEGEQHPVAWQILPRRHNGP